MITATKLPEALVPAENPVWVSLSTNSLYTSTGSYAMIVLQLSQAAIAGNKITFNWNDYSVTFTCADNPDQSGLQFPPLGINTFSGWLLTFADFLRTNYLLSQDFDIEKNGVTILLTAKEKGTASNITASSITITGCTAHSFAGTDRVARTDLKIVLQLMHNDISIHEELLDVDSDGNTQCDISEILLPYLENKFTFPGNGNTKMVRHSGMCKEFGVRFAEKYDETIYGFSLNHNFHAIKAGISKIDQAIFNENNTSFYEQMLASKAFLTNAPKERSITLDANERLYFCLLSGDADVNVMVDYYENDELIESINVDTLDNVSKYDVIELLIDPTLLSIEASHNKFDFYLVDGGDYLISEKRTYYIDTDTYYNKRNLLFRSSLSGFDIFMFKGIGQADNEFERTIIKKALPSGFILKDFETSQGNVLQTKNLTINSGWISYAELNWLNDIFLNKEVYLLINEKAVPHNIVSKKQKQKKDNEFLYSIEIELKESYTNTHYSDFNNMIVAEPASGIGTWKIGNDFIVS